MIERKMTVQYQWWPVGDKTAKVGDAAMSDLDAHTWKHVSEMVQGGFTSGELEFNIPGEANYEGMWSVLSGPCDEKVAAEKPEKQKESDKDLNEARKRADQIELLGVCAKYSDTGEWTGMFSYPGCGHDLVRMGLAKEDKNITPAGRAVLWLLGKGPDQTSTKAVYTFSFDPGVGSNPGDA